MTAWLVLPPDGTGSGEPLTVKPDRHCDSVRLLPVLAGYASSAPWSAASCSAV